MILNRLASLTRFLIALAISAHCTILGWIADAGWKKSEAAFRLSAAAQIAAQTAKVEATAAARAAKATQIACDADAAQYWPKRTA